MSNSYEKPSDPQISDNYLIDRLKVKTVPYGTGIGYTVEVRLICGTNEKRVAGYESSIQEKAIDAIKEANEWIRILPGWNKEDKPKETRESCTRCGAWIVEKDRSPDGFSTCGNGHRTHNSSYV